MDNGSLLSTNKNSVLLVLLQAKGKNHKSLSKQIDQVKPHMQNVDSLTTTWYLLRERFAYAGCWKVRPGISVSVYLRRWINPKDPKDYEIQESILTNRFDWNYPLCQFQPDQLA